MKKNTFTGNTVAAFIFIVGMSSLVMAQPISHMTSAYFHTPLGALTFLPTALPAMSIHLTLSQAANQAVLAAQEPAFMVLNEQADANEDPLFKNAVSELTKANESLQKLSDQEIAAIILSIGENLATGF